MHTYFLGLSLVGYDSLWGRMIRSGVVGVVGIVKRTGTFPNGDLLRTNFTGIYVFDQFLIPAVIFYNNILSNGSSADRMLLVSLFTTMQSMSHCMLVLGWRRGKRPWWASWEYLFWGTFNQAWGAAAVYPLWCFTHAQRFLIIDQNTGEEEDVGSTEGREALAILATSFLGAITPALILYPAFNPSCTTHQRQGLIAFYRFAPLMQALAHPLFIWIYGKIPQSWIRNRGPAKPKAYVAASLVFSGMTAAIGHGWALFCSGKGGVRRTFLPAEGVDVRSPMAIADGARDFLQMDIFVITAALVPFADLVFRSSRVFIRLRKRSTWLATGLGSIILRIGALTLASSIISPGAVMAFSLAGRVYS